MTGSNFRSNKEGRRPSSLLTITEAGGNEGVKVCERWGRRKGALGPPGMVGRVVMLIGLEIFMFTDGFAVCLDDAERNLPLPEAEDKEPEEDEGGAICLSFLDKLVFRPNEEKNPPVLEMEAEGAKERIEEDGVPTLELDRDGGGFIANEGYGRVRDMAVGVISP